MSVKVERSPPSENLLYKDVNIEEEDLPELEQSFTNYQIQLIHNQRSVIDEDPFEEMTDAQMLAMFDMIEKEVETKIDERIDEQLGAVTKDMEKMRMDLERMKQENRSLEKMDACPDAKRKEKEKFQNE